MPKIAPKKPAKSNSTSEIEVGSIVTFDNDGETVQGTVTEIDGKIANVEDETAVYEIALKELTLVEDDDPPAKPVKGRVVEKPSKSKGKGTSLSSLFKKAEVQKGGGGIPVGEWDALLVDAGYIVTPKGHSAFFEYVATNDEDEDAYGKSSKKMFFLINDQDEVNDNGWNYFKTDLLTLGMEEDDFDSDDPEDINALLEKLAKGQPWVEIKVVQRKDDPRYNNIYVNALKDQDDKPDLDDIPY